MIDLDNATAVIQKLTENICNEELEKVICDSSVAKIIQRFGEFLQHLRSSHGQLASFWMSFVDMVNTLLGLIRASREGNWTLHLACVRAFIPWSFAYDKQNYARYTSVYYSQMTRLPETHPIVSVHDFALL